MIALIWLSNRMSRGQWSNMPLITAAREDRSRIRNKVMISATYIVWLDIPMHDAL